MGVILKSQNKNYIPDIVDKELKNWRQPERSEITINDKYALMPKDTFLQLQDVPLKFHAIKLPGKMSRTEINSKPFLYWFGLHENPIKCSIEWREIVII
jgi:hypothetical protein